jgi:hypothetical protein
MSGVASVKAVSLSVTATGPVPVSEPVSVAAPSSVGVTVSAPPPSLLPAAASFPAWEADFWHAGNAMTVAPQRIPTQMARQSCPFRLIIIID